MGIMYGHAYMYVHIFEGLCVCIFPLLIASTLAGLNTKLKPE